jgi:cellulose synthase/poly-beta-1,6-N-acetylglucosamine synthase-like glycosyltransferase
LKNLEMWWMLVDVLEDIIKHAVMYGPGNSCSLSCSISFCFFSYIWKLEKNLVNFNSIDVCFQEFFFFSLSFLYFRTLCFPGSVLLLNFENGWRDSVLSPNLPEGWESHGQN